MIREKGGEDGSRCGYTKKETGERDVVPYEFYINFYEFYEVPNTTS